MTSKQSKPKRRSTRFPSNGTIATIDLLPDGKTFTPTLNALVLEEAYKGCSFVSITNREFREHQELRIQVGELPDIKAEVRWIKNLDSKIFLVGVLFLE